MNLDLYRELIISNILEASRLSTDDRDYILLHDILYGIYSKKQKQFLKKTLNGMYNSTKR